MSVPENCLLILCLSVIIVMITLTHSRGRYCPEKARPVSSSSDSCSADPKYLSDITTLSLTLRMNDLETSLGDCAVEDACYRVAQSSDVGRHVVSSPHPHSPLSCDWWCAGGDQTSQEGRGRVQRLPASDGTQQGVRALLCQLLPASRPHHGRPGRGC